MIGADPARYGYSCSTIENGSYSLATIKLQEKTELITTDTDHARKYLSNSPANNSSRVFVRESETALRLFNRNFCLSEWNCPSGGSVGPITAPKSCK